MTSPSWLTDSIYNHMEKVAEAFVDPRYIVPTDEAKRVKAGPLLSYVVKNMDVKRNSPEVSDHDKKTWRKAKFYMISGHDITLTTFLETLGVYETQLVPYAAQAIVELHKGTKDQKEDNTDEHYIRVMAYCRIIMIILFINFK